jgi:hypothetical protein
MAKLTIDRVVGLITESAKRKIGEELKYLLEQIGKFGKRAGVEQQIDRLLSTALKAFTTS